MHNVPPEVDFESSEGERGDILVMERGGVIVRREGRGRWEVCQLNEGAESVG